MANNISNLRRAGLTDSQAKSIDLIMSKQLEEIKLQLEYSIKHAQAAINKINEFGCGVSSVDVDAIAHEVGKAQELSHKYQAMKDMAMDMVIERLT